MYKLPYGQEPVHNKKLPRWIYAGAALLLIISAIYANMPKVSAGNFVEHVVEPGETLWKIAVEYVPDKDPREVIWEIKRENECGNVIWPGQRLLIPGGE